MFKTLPRFTHKTLSASSCRRQQQQHPCDRNHPSWRKQWCDYRRAILNDRGRAPTTQCESIPEPLRRYGQRGSHQAALQHATMTHDIPRFLSAPRQSVQRDIFGRDCVLQCMFRVRWLEETLCSSLPTFEGVGADTHILPISYL